MLSTVCLLIQEGASARDEERASVIFAGAHFTLDDEVYRVEQVSRNRENQLLLHSAKVREDAMENTSPSEEQDELLTVREVAKQLRVDETTVRRWIKKGVLQGVFLPSGSRYNSYRIKRSTLEQILAGRA